MGDSERTGGSGVTAREFEIGRHRMAEPGGPPPRVLPCKKHWIEFRVVDDQNKPLRDTRLQLQQQGEVQYESPTGVNGDLRVEKIADPPYDLIAMSGAGLFEFVKVEEAPAPPAPAKK
ncbi:MAG TPA: hypothetical protein VN442_16335 [Bryobacteraceae bacterium]|nr:hypothetical protein [Bryobacteraceae bacterium]